MATFYQSRRVPSSPSSFLGIKHHLLLKQTSAVTDMHYLTRGDERSRSPSILRLAFMLSTSSEDYCTVASVILKC
eukprot:scaffold30961_cov101-Skeletonema_dohrnii-CCMP3373.AAC.4